MGCLSVVFGQIRQRFVPFAWQKSFLHAIRTHDVVILHGNIRDLYVFTSKGEEPTAVLELTREQALKLGAVLTGTLAKMGLVDLAMTPAAMSNGRVTSDD